MKEQAGFSSISLKKIAIVIKSPDSLKDLGHRSDVVLVDKDEWYRLEEYYNLC